MKIFESLLERWVISSSSIITKFFIRIYRTYLKDRLVCPFLKRQPIKGEDNIKTVLKGELLRLTRSEDDLNITIDYENWERKLNIEKGGTKRYFKTVLPEFDIWSIDNEAEDVIPIGRDPAEFQLFTE